MGWFGRDPRVHWLDAQSPTRVEDALALVARADERADAVARGEVPEPDEADGDAPVRRSLGS